MYIREWTLVPSSLLGLAEVLVSGVWETALYGLAASCRSQVWVVGVVSKRAHLEKTADTVSRHGMAVQPGT